ncbi:glycosyl transferase [Burkholderia metallica]|nr:glycosyl transferase [Burkholderia metallica]
MPDCAETTRRTCAQRVRGRRTPCSCGRRTTGAAAEGAQAVDGLKRVVSALSKQTVRPASLAQWIIAHDGLPAYTCAEIAALGARPVDFVEIGVSTGNYDAKNDAFRRDVFVQFPPSRSTTIRTRDRVACCGTRACADASFDAV